jgi:methylmalonyl-CoA mutase N-terminal domain/subunit
MDERARGTGRDRDEASPEAGARSRSGIPLRPYYSAGDRAGGEGEAPGAFPYTRGRRAAPTPTGGWIQRGLAGEGSAESSNRQLHALIASGQTGIDVIGDGPTQAMLDPDHPLVVHGVGTTGVSLCSKDDYLALFRDLPLERLSVSSSVPSLASLAGLVLAARAAGVALDRLRGSVLQAPLYAEDCGYSTWLPVALRLRVSADVMAFCAAHLPRFHAYVEDTYFFSEAGLDAVEEMALGFVEIRRLVREMLGRGVPVDAFAPRIAILVNASMDFFEEIAKLRATRRLFARMMKEEFGATDPRSLAVVITCHTSGLALTAQQPINNVVRGTVQALAMVLGGVDALEISAFDEGYRTPSPEAHRVGLRTQQVIALESGVARVLDPLGGSHYVESLTDEMERRIREKIGEIESMGDAGDLAERGWFRDFFRGTIERYQRGLASGRLAQVGVNVHRVPPEEDRLLREVVERKIAPAREVIARVRGYKAGRDMEAVRAALRRLRADARTPSANLVPPMIEALDAGATVGEAAGALRQACGLPHDPFDMTPPVLAPDP